MTAFNFNSYILREEYVVVDSSQFTFSNAPTSMSGLFLFIVLPAFESNALQQIVIMTSGNVVYTRSYNGSNQTFGSWTNPEAGTTAQLLTGYVKAAGTVAATDTILQAFDKIGASLNTTTGQIIVGNSSNIATPVAMSGDATISNTGVVTLTNSAVIGEALTGFSAVAGTITSSDTILTGVEKLAFITYGYIKGFSGAVADGAITITGGSDAISGNLSVATTSVGLALNKIYYVTVILDVTTASASGSTFALTAANASVLGSQSIAVGASVTNQYVMLTGIIQSTGTASPSLSITASSTTGTVSIAADSSIMIQAK